MGRTPLRILAGLAIWRSSFVIALGLLCLRGGSAQVTFAGSLKTLGGDGTTLRQPLGAAIDALGNVFVADCKANNVKQFAVVNGVLPNSPVASVIFSDSQVTNCPTAVAVDNRGSASVPGTVFVASVSNGSIQMFPYKSGAYAQQSIAVGTGFSKPIAIALDPKTGNLYVADAGAKTVKVIQALGGAIQQGSPTVSLNIAGYPAGFSSLTGLTVDADGNLFVVASPTCLLEVDSTSLLNPGNIPAMVCLGALLPHNPAIFTSLQGVASATPNRLYVSDQITASSAVVEQVTLSGSNLIVSPQITGINSRILGSPRGLAANSRGDVVVVDGTFNVAAEFNTSQVVDFGSIQLGALSQPRTLSLRYPPGTYGMIQEGLTVLLDTTASQSTIVPSRNFFDLTSGLCRPMFTGPDYDAQSCTVDLAFKPARFGAQTGVMRLMGNNGSVLVEVPLTATGTIIETPLSATFDHPQGIGFGRNGVLYVADTLNRRLLSLDASGTLGVQYPSVDSSTPVADASGNIVYADSRTNQIFQISAGGLASALPGSFSAPHGVALDSAGNLYVADSGNKVIKKLAKAGTTWSTATVIALITPNGFGYPTAVTVDAKGGLFVADTTGNAVWYFSLANGSSSSYNQGTLLGNSALNAPWGLAINTVTGDLFVADSGNNAVKMFSPPYQTGNTLASDFQHPMGVASDNLGNVYVADTNANRVVKLVVDVAQAVQ